MHEKIRTLLVDDEPAASDLLSNQLGKHFPEIEVIAVASSAKDALIQIAELDLDLVFLDIDMPWMTGLELVKVIPKQNVEVIFVTAHDELAVQAIRTSALDFISKPVDITELERAIENYKQTKNKRNPIDLFNFLSQQIEAISQKSLKRIALPTSKGISYFDLKNIAVIEADNIYTKLYLNDGRAIMAFKPLKEIEKMLEGEMFFRCHKSFILNLQQVATLSKSEGMNALLQNGMSIPISRSKRHAFSEIMNNL